MQSWGGEVRLLPALPRAWPEGSLYGVRARGGLELDLDWAKGKLRQLQVRGKPGQAVTMVYADRKIAISLNAEGRRRMTF